MIFSSSDLLKSHVQSEHNSFPCQYCTEEFGNVDDYARHGNYEHSDNVQLNWFVCDMCGLYYPSAKDIQDHTKVCTTIKVEVNEIDYDMQDVKNVQELMNFEMSADYDAEHKEEQSSG